MLVQPTLIRRQIIPRMVAMVSMAVETVFYVNSIPHVCVSRFITKMVLTIGAVLRQLLVTP
ncbi:hypothetical protein D3C80_843550 [compost metagenome]